MSQYLDKIPVDNEKEALHFCRLLYEFLQNASPEHTLESEPEISVVTAIFNEEENVETLYQRLTSTLTSLTSSYEIVFVDDGSSDDSLRMLHQLEELDERVVVVALSRNFGQQIAFSAGLERCKGKSVVVMDSDLQDPPEAIPKLLQRLSEGYDVAYAVRTDRKEGRVKRFFYSLFYRILRLVSRIQIPLDAGDFCAMDRAVVDAINRFPERNRFLRGLRSWVGLRQTGVEIERDERFSGEPKYSFLGLISLALDGFVSFSDVPLRLISLLGCIVSVFSVFLAIFYFFKKLFFGLNPAGFATIVVMISFFAGVQLITIGVIGEYIGRILMESKKRPVYLTKKSDRALPLE